MSKARYDKKHISMWIDEGILKICEEHQKELGMKSRSEYIEAALEAYSEFANKKATEYVEKNVLPRMEKMIYSLENRIGRQMFKLIVESAKICRILFDHLELDFDDFDELHEKCVKEAKHLNGAITFPSSMRGKKLAELYEEE